MMPLVVGAVGVVYGDIGTSPLYTLRTAFTGTYGLSLPPDNVLGVLSVIVWALVIVVTLKYITLIPRADALVAGGTRHFRRGDVLRRRDDHSRDHGPRRGRRAWRHRAGIAPVHR